MLDHRHTAKPRTTFLEGKFAGKEGFLYRTHTHTHTQTSCILKMDKVKHIKKSKRIYRETYHTPMEI